MCKPGTPAASSRGPFIESFPLFGYPLDQYETLFEEKLELFLAVRRRIGLRARSSAAPGIIPR